MHHTVASKDFEGRWLLSANTSFVANMVEAEIKISSNWIYYEIVTQYDVTE